jgi:uncharacterized membrane protein YgaE (UPF0421/DUF939 family)
VAETHKLWTGARTALARSVRATIASLLSLAVARGLKLPEFYWAPISTLVVLLATTDPLALAWQRFAGTALGAVLGAALGRSSPSSWLVYGAGIFICGLLAHLLRLGSAYRFGAITLSIVLLISHRDPVWIVAIRRFVEVSLGIAVALLVDAVWKSPGE